MIHRVTRLFLLSACLLAFVLLASCLGVALAKKAPLPSTSAASSVPSHTRVRHHQGESLKQPHEYLDGVDETRFRDAFHQHLKGSHIRLADLTPGTYSVGVGMGDVTGQVAEIGFMGYAVPNQKGGGLLQRLRARAFIFVDENGAPGDQAKRLVYVSMDLCMGFQMLKYAVLDELTALYGPDLYTHANVILSGTHTHATPGGIGGTVLVDLTTFGFIKENFQAAVDGIVTAIQRAHASIQPAVIKMAVGECDGCNINRSPSAYLLDPEGNEYAHNTDHEMTVLRIESTNGTELGAVTWFAVHGTSLNNTNRLVSGDNKGLASYLFEREKNPTGTLPGQGAFVAAFGQSNLGDVSPNTRGAFCPDGTPCNFNTSTCGNPPRSEQCIAQGPGVDQYDSMRIIAKMQLDAARALYDSASQVLTNEGVDYRYQYFDMQAINVSAEFTSTGHPGATCQPALGYSFAAGTTDGAGDFDFTQGTTSGNPFWNFVGGLLAKPTPEQIACQAPKPILIDVGLTRPMPWVPTILPEHVARIGNLWIVAVPGEWTTMSGRRTRNLVKQILQEAGQWFANSHVVLAGLSNSYSHYITTYEEFQQQRYEGASTLYGPHTLAAHMQNIGSLVDAMIAGSPVPQGPLPMDMRNSTFSFMPGVIEDNTPLGVRFGDVATQVAGSYAVGQTVRVVFWGASPRNDLQLESSFLFVDQLDPTTNTWTVVAVDADIETRFLWTRVGLDQSQCTVEWDLTPTNTVVGATYRIRHQGVSKNILGQLTPYTGISATFTVTAAKAA